MPKTKRKLKDNLKSENTKVTYQTWENRKEKLGKKTHKKGIYGRILKRALRELFFFLEKKMNFEAWD